MTLTQAMQTNLWVKRPQGEAFCYFKAGTGPFTHLVHCDYFVLREGSEESFSTSIDLYPEDIFASDYELA